MKITFTTKSLPDDYVAHLPEGLVIRKTFPQVELNLSDVGFWQVECDSEGNPALVGEEGRLVLSDPRQLIEAMKQKHYNFGFGFLDALLRLFPKEFREDLYYLTEAYWGGVKVRRLQNELSFKFGRRTHKLWNVESYFVDKHTIDSLDTLKADVELLVNSFREQGIPVSTFLSVGSSSRALLMNTPGLRSEFLRVGGYRRLDDWFQLKEGPAFVVSRLGEVDSYHYDTIQAYNRALAVCPSLRGCYEHSEPAYIEEAVYTSAILDWVYVPPDYLFPPVPVTLCTGRGRLVRVFPTGLLRGVRVSKPMLELLVHYGVKFKVREALHFIPFRSLVYPYANVCNLVAKAVETLPYPIHGKALYWPFVGSMLSVYEVIDPKSGDIYSTTTPVFNPIIGTHVSAAVYAEVYRQLMRADRQYAIRSDAWSSSPLDVDPARFREVPHGPTFFYNQQMKDFPGQTRYRDLVGECRDLPYIKVPHTYRVSLRSHIEHDMSLACKKERYVKIPVGRQGRLQRPVARVGELLSSNVETYAPDVDEMLEVADGYIDYKYLLGEK